MTDLMEFSNKSSLDQLNINVRWMKEWTITTPHSHLFIFPYTAIWIVLSGSAVIELDQVQYTLEAGDIVSIPPQTYQSWVSRQSDQPFHYLSLACEGKIGYFDFIRLYRFPRVVSDVCSEDFNTLVTLWRGLAADYAQFLKHFDKKDLKATENKYRGDMGEDEYPAFRLNTDQTIGHLRIRAGGALWTLKLFEALRSHLPEQPLTYDNCVFEVCTYVEKQLKEPPTLDELAQFVSLSKEQLRTLFQSTLGISPMKYVRQIRIQRARDLLLLSTYPIKEIAEMVGFENQHHFSKVFHSSVGVSPMVYRRSQKGSSSKQAEYFTSTSPQQF
jgi:AraC-like DNA-binding protein/mannose-6-phosphate isomerase-like protein (cupin superfamily)